MVVTEEKRVDFIDDTVRKEVIFGEIYLMASPSARHQDVVFNIAFLIKTLSKKENCKPRVAPFDLKIECNGENIVQPDVMIFCDGKLCAVFEVLSPSTAIKDKILKPRLYECAGIREYFIVESEYEIVEKFELRDGEYEFVGNFSKEDEIEIKCIDAKLKIGKVFEGVE